MRYQEVNQCEQITMIKKEPRYQIKISLKYIVYSKKLSYSD